MKEDESGGCVGCQATLGRYVAGSAAMDLTVFEDGRGVAEDEINVSLNEAIAEVLTPGCRVQGVLPAQESAFSKNSSVRMNRYCDRLSARSIAVLEGDVRSFELCAFHVHRAAEERAADILGSRVEPDHSSCRIGSAKRNTRPVLGDHDAFAIRARPDVNYQALFRPERAMVERVVNG